VKGIYGVGLLICFVFSANAQDRAFKTDFVKCAKTSEMSSRLACYDKLANESGLLDENAEAEAKAEVENWEVVTETSPVDDSKSVFLINYAQEPIIAGYEEVRPALHLRCLEGEPSAYISWGTFIGTGTAKLTTRYDSYNAQEEIWDISTDNTATFSSKPILVISYLGHADRFLARVAPYGENPVIAIFDVSGLSDVVEPLKKACELK